MNEENTISQPNEELENHSAGNEITDTDLEQVSGGLNAPSTPNSAFKFKGNLSQQKLIGNNLGSIKTISRAYDDESPKE